MAIQTVHIAALQKDGGTVTGAVNGAKGYYFVDCDHHN